MIDRDYFFDTVRAGIFGGHLNTSQVAGLNAILLEWDASHERQDLRWLAYALGTTHHETDKTIQPLREYGRGAGMSYGQKDEVTGEVYYGRGFVQLTWKVNYEKMSKRLGIDLVNYPDRALEIHIAAQILLVGMIEGLFSGDKLVNHFNTTESDWVNARRVVNGLDKANLVAGYGLAYDKAIRQWEGTNELLA